MQARDQGFCMSVGSDVLFLNRVYDPDQFWLPFARVIYPKSEPVEPEVKEPKYQKRIPKNQLQWSVVPEPQYDLDFIEGKRITKGNRKKLHKEKFPTFDRRKGSGALLELAIKGEPQGRKLRGGRDKAMRDRATLWCMENLRGKFIPDRYYVFELADDYALALLTGKHFVEIENITKVG